MQLACCVQNAAQAAQVLQECNAVLGLPSTSLESLSSGQSPPASMLPSNSCVHNSHTGAPPSRDRNSKTTHRPKPVPERLHLELPPGKLDAEQQLPPKRKKCTLLPAATNQPIHEEDKVLTDSQTDQTHDQALQSQQHPEHTDKANSHYRPCKETSVMMRKHAELRHLSTEELQNKLCRLTRLTQLCMTSLPDGGQKVMATCHQLQDELDSRVAGMHSKQTSLCADEHNRLAKPSSQTTAPTPMPPACHGKNLVDVADPEAHVWNVPMVEPQYEAQLVSSPLTSLKVGVQPGLQEASKVLSEKNQVESCLDATLGQSSDQAGSSAAVSSPAVITYAQHCMIAGLMYHFAARRGPSWLF